jgi:hypothetical protein
MFGDDRKLEDPTTLAMRAMQCALVIQTDLAKYDSGEGFVLTLHVGIGIGNMYSLYVGGVDGGWVCVVMDGERVSETDRRLMHWTDC